MRQTATILVVIFYILLCATGCADKESPGESAAKTKTEDGKASVIFSLYDDNNPWPIALATDIESVAEERGYMLTVLNAEGDAEKQYNDIVATLEDHPDFLILSAVDSETGSDCVSAANESNVPVLLVARNTDSFVGKDCISLIACNYEGVGYSEGQALLRLFGDKECRIIELAGAAGSSNSTSISRGFHRLANANDNLEIVATVDTNSSTREALQAMENVIQSGVEFNAVFCHSDSDALGAIQALKTAGLIPGIDPDSGDIIIVSNCGFEDAIKAIITGELYCTFSLNARLGSTIFDTIEAYWLGEEIEPHVYISFKQIDSSNAKEWVGNGYQF